MVPQDRFVLLVSDRPERATLLARGIDIVMTCRVMACGASLPPMRPAALIVDCDPDPAEHSEWFETLRSWIDAATPCIYLARGGTREAAIVARLRQPIVVSARSGASGLIATLRKALAQSPETPRRATERQIETATSLVARIFEAAASGDPPSPAEADQGTEIVLATVSEVGVRSFLDMVWRHDFTTYQHSLSVAGFAAAFATELHFSAADLRRLTKAALLHDVGKARIPPAILNKPEPLYPEEMAVMRTHAAIGADLLVEAGGFEQEVIDVARWHHERLDGSGYPDGLKGSAISDLVRLVAVCDVHSALTERRVYRAPMPAAKAMEIMDGMAGQLDPDLLRAYRPIIGSLEAVR